MKKVSSELTLKLTREGKATDFKNWDIFLPNGRKLTHDLLIVFGPTRGTKEIFLDIEVKNPYIPKTNKQLGYLHAAIFKAFYSVYREAGLEHSEEQIRNQLKTHHEINFIEEIYNPITGDTETVPKSMADASKEEAMQFIDRLIRLAASIDLQIEEPNAYRIRNGITVDDWNKWNE